MFPPRFRHSPESPQDVLVLQVAPEVVPVGSVWVPEGSRAALCGRVWAAPGHWLGLCPPSRAAPGAQWPLTCAQRTSIPSRYSDSVQRAPPAPSRAPDISLGWDVPQSVSEGPQLPAAAT